MSIQSKELRAHLLLLSANLFYGINYSVAKIPMPDFIQPFGIVLLRGITATLFFWIISLFIKTKQTKIKKKDWFPIILAAIFGIAINQLLFFKGLDLTNPISASLLMTITPIAVLLVAFVLMYEKITFYKGLGLLLGISGALILILNSSQNQNADAPNPLLGNTFILLNAVSYAIYLVISKKLLQKYGSIQFMKYIFLIGTIIIFPFGFTDVLEAKWIAMGWKEYSAVAFILIFVSCLAYYFNTIALKTLSSSIVGIYIYSQPVFAVLIAIILGSDSIDLLKIISALAIFIGVYLVSNNYKK